METTEFVIDGHSVIIDAEDAHFITSAPSFRLVDGWKGRKYLEIYVSRTGYRRLHRLVMNTPNGLETDHRDGNGLNNSKSNLRIATHRQNALNSIKHKPAASKFKGLYYVERIDCWRVRIRLEGNKRKCLGYFKSEIEAAYAYDVASIEHHGEFGRRNFLPLM